MNTMLTSGKAAAYLGVSVKTLQRWERKGRLQAERTATGQRVYARQALDHSLPRKPVEVKRIVVAYCRVSSSGQKPDLKNQRKALEDFCLVNSLPHVLFIEEIGGGLNLKRPKFLDLMDRVESHEVSHLLIAHKDRLVRFGFPWFERFCTEHGTELFILNNEQLSPEQEMVQDLLTIVHCFSARLYGLRNYKKGLQAALAQQDKP